MAALLAQILETYDPLLSFRASCRESFADHVSFLCSMLHRSDPFLWPGLHRGIAASKRKDSEE